MLLTGPCWLSRALILFRSDNVITLDAAAEVVNLVKALEGHEQNPDLSLVMIAIFKIGGSGQLAERVRGGLPTWRLRKGLLAVGHLITVVDDITSEFVERNVHVDLNDWFLTFECGHDSALEEIQGLVTQLARHKSQHELLLILAVVACHMNTVQVAGLVRELHIVIVISGNLDGSLKLQGSIRKNLLDRLEEDPFKLLQVKHTPLEYGVEVPGCADDDVVLAVGRVLHVRVLLVKMLSHLPLCTRSRGRP